MGDGFESALNENALSVLAEGGGSAVPKTKAGGASEDVASCPKENVVGAEESSVAGAAPNEKDEGTESEGVVKSKVNPVSAVAGASVALSAVASGLHHWTRQG